MNTSRSWSAALLVALTVSTLSAQQAPLAEVVGLEPGGRFGDSLARVGDLDGDGTPDVLVGAPKAPLGGDRRGQAVALSGADLSVLFSIDGTSDLYELGSSVASLGDVNDDGVPDLAVGEPRPYGLLATPGFAYICSGADGSVLHTLSGDTIDDGFGHALAGLDDVDGDGVSDVAVSAPNVLLDGRVAVISGATGSHLFDVPQSAPGLLYGTALATTPDRDGDGLADLLIGVDRWKGPNPSAVGAVFWVSGADGALIQVLQGVPFSSGNGPLHMGRNLGLLGDVDGDGQHDVWGAADELVRFWSGADGSVLRDLEASTETWDHAHAADLGDLDGDGRAEYLLADPEAWGVTQRSGRARLFDGDTADQFSMHRGEISYGKLGTSVLVLGDADADGRPEYLLGRPHHAGQEPGEVLLFEVTPQVRLLHVVDDDPALTWFGSDVRATGDVDADGVPDILVGEPFDSTAANLAGRARLFSGRDGSLLLTLLGEAAVDYLGWSVDGMGDLDGDGVPDLAVSLPVRQPPLAGAARLVSGATGATLHQFEGTSSQDRFGYGLACVGDVDADGVDDLAVGAPYDDTLASDGGALRIYSGADGSLLHELLGTQPFHNLGQAVAGGADVDGDGVPDVAASAPGTTVAGSPVGAVRVFSGATDGELLTVFGEVAGSGFGVDGTSLALVGDLDGDGLGDLVVGAAGQGGGSNPKGKLFAFAGSSGALLWTYGDTSVQGEGIGQSLAAYPDVDGDGRVELLVGVPGALLDEGDQGEVRLLSGADGRFLNAWPGFTADLRMGSSVDTLGDRDFDGLPEILVAGDHELTDDGAFSVWLGGDGSSPWDDRGGSLAGAGGAPTLTPAGSLVGSTVALVDLRGAAPFAATTLVIGLSELAAPFKGGVLVPQPDILIAGLTTDGAGELLGLGGVWPAGVPASVESFYQLWVVDAGGPAGLAATQGVRGVTP